LSYPFSGTQIHQTKQNKKIILSNTSLSSIPDTSQWVQPGLATSKKMATYESSPAGHYGLVVDIPIMVLIASRVMSIPNKNNLFLDLGKGRF
jgi:hypothetical protein